MDHYDVTKEQCDNETVLHFDGMMEICYGTRSHCKITVELCKHCSDSLDHYGAAMWYCDSIKDHYDVIGEHCNATLDYYDVTMNHYDITKELM